MKKKYKVIAKINNDKFVKYNVNNLIAFSNFLDREFGGFMWFNVYTYTKDGNGEQIANYTNKNRPNTRYVNL
jgi:hypothetical protein